MAPAPSDQPVTNWPPFAAIVAPMMNPASSLARRRRIWKSLPPCSIHRLQRTLRLQPEVYRCKKKPPQRCGFECKSHGRGHKQNSRKPGQYTEVFDSQSARALDPVDGFDQDCAAGQGDKGGVILCGFLASHGDPLKALEFAECLLDTGAAFVECLGEEDRLLLGV